MGKIRIQPGQAVGLKLTPEERQLLLENVIFTGDEIEAKLRIVLAGSTEVQLTLDDLEDLAGCLAAEANHTKDRKLERKLDRIGDRIEKLLGMFEEV